MICIPVRKPSCSEKNFSDNITDRSLKMLLKSVNVCRFLIFWKENSETWNIWTQLFQRNGWIKQQRGCSVLTMSVICLIVTALYLFRTKEAGNVPSSVFIPIKLFCGCALNAICHEGASFYLWKMTLSQNCYSSLSSPIRIT